MTFGKAGGLVSFSGILTDCIILEISFTKYDKEMRFHRLYIYSTKQLHNLVIQQKK